MLDLPDRSPGQPDDLPSNLVMTGFDTFTPAIFHAANLVQPTEREEYERSDAIDLLIEFGRTIDAISEIRAE